MKVFEKWSLVLNALVLVAGMVVAWIYYGQWTTMEASLAYSQRAWVLRDAVLGPGGKERIWLPLPGLPARIVDRLRTGPTRIEVRGRLDYDDVVGTGRFSGICFYIEVDENLTATRAISCDTGNETG